MSTSCDFKKLISAYADGLLPENKMALMEEHIERCALCRKELDDIRLTEQLLKKIPEIEPSKDFARSFWQKVDALETSESKWSITNLFSLGWRPWLTTSAAVILLLVIVTFYRTDFIQPDEDEIFLVENIEFFEAYSIVDNLEMLENWDVIEQLEEKSL